MSCFHTGMDYGADCDVPVSAVISRTKYTSDWFFGMNIIDPDLECATDCQRYCNEREQCDYFFFQYESKRCYLKQAYTCEQLAAGCQQYTNRSDGVSGPASCTGK